MLSEHAGHSDSRCLRASAMVSFDSGGRITTLSSDIRSLTPAAVPASSTWLRWHAQCNVRRAWCNGQVHTHATFGQLHRGLLWQRLTCIPECLESWILGSLEEGTGLVLPHVNLQLPCINRDVLDVMSRLSLGADITVSGLAFFSSGFTPNFVALCSWIRTSDFGHSYSAKHSCYDAY